MSLITLLTGYVPPETPPVLMSILPSAARTKLTVGQLPILQSNKLILQANEVCHFVDMGAVITQRKRTMGTNSGTSYRIVKGVYGHYGRRQSVPIEENVYTKGIFYITNKRAAFVAQKNGFDCKLANLTAVTPYTNAIMLQFGSKTHTVLLPDGISAYNALSLLI